MLASPLFSIFLLAFLVVLLVVPSLRRMPGLGVIPAILIIAFVVWQRGDHWAAIGLIRPESWSRTIGLSLIFGTLIALAAVMIIEPLTERWTGTRHDLSALGALRGKLRNTLTWIAAAWLTAATLEEMIFRGFMMRELASLMGVGPTVNVLNVLTTSIVFGCAHWYQGKPGALSTGIVSLMLGAIFIWNDFRLWLLIFTHGMIDTIGLLLIFLGWDQRLKRLIFRSHTHAQTS
jgi:membrane protease YdiL (CAAX protease family)